MPREKKRFAGRGGRGKSASKQQERITRAALKRERKSGSYLNPRDPDFKSFANQLAVQGLALKDVPGDGNCLFRALSDQLNDSHTNHRTLRRDIVTYMREYRDDFEPFLDQEITFDQYMSELAKDGEYAGNDVIVAFTRCYSTHVVIHQLNAPRWEVRAPHTVQMAAATSPKTLHIAYLNGEHYCSIKPLLHAESAGTTHLLPQLSVSSEKGEDIVHTPSKSPGSHTSNKKRSIPFSSSSNGSGSTCTNVPAVGPAHQTTEHHHTQKPAGPLEQEYTPPNQPVGSAPISDAAVERVATSTGCKDMALVEDCLRENDYKVELAIVEVLQLMSLAEDTCSKETATTHHNLQPNLQLPNPHLQIKTSVPLHSPISQDTRANSGSLHEKPSLPKLSPHQEPSSHSPHQPMPSSELKPLSGPHQACSQKPAKAHSLHHQQRLSHLSNRERKELAKAARKQRRAQGRKENRTKPATGDSEVDSAVDPVGTTVI